MKIDVLKLTFVLELHILYVLKTSMILQNETWMTDSFCTTICFFSTEYWMGIGNSRFLLKYCIWSEFMYCNLCLFKIATFAWPFPPRMLHKSCSHTSLCLKSRGKILHMFRVSIQISFFQKPVIFREGEWKVVLLIWQTVQTLMRNLGTQQQILRNSWLFFQIWKSLFKSISFPKPKVKNSLTVS